MLSIINIILGAALLVSGRKLFWLFVAGAGFVAGGLFATRVMHGPEWLSIVIGLATGIAFAVLAVFLKSIAIALAGFVLGGSILSSAAGALGFEKGGLILYMIGGILGILLVSMLFDWALISLSAFGGATLLVQAFNLQGSASALAFIVLLIAGFTIQASAMRKDRKENDG